MNNKDVIKALEVVSTTANCRECGFYSGKVCNCSQVTAKNALDLINSLQAEITEKTEMLEHQAEIIKILENSAKDKTAEIERLKEIDIRKAKDLRPLITKTIKSEARKEFAERLKEKSSSCVACNGDVPIEETRLYQFSKRTLDNLLAELDGKENENA